MAEAVGRWRLKAKKGVGRATVRAEAKLRWGKDGGRPGTRCDALGTARHSSEREIGWWVVRLDLEKKEAATVQRVPEDDKVSNA